MYELTGRTTRPYFRRPYGDIDQSVLRDVAADGYGIVVMWTIDTLGWDGASADAIVQRSLSMAEPGAIIVMHVGSGSQDAAALRRVIEGLRGAAYSFGTIDDVLRQGVCQWLSVSVSQRDQPGRWSIVHAAGGGHPLAASLKGRERPRS